MFCGRPADSIAQKAAHLPAPASQQTQIDDNPPPSSRVTPAAAFDRRMEVAKERAAAARQRARLALRRAEEAEERAGGQARR